MADSSTDLNDRFDELGGERIGNVLLAPTKIYVKPVMALLEKVSVRSLAHITGGGFYENIPRALPEGLGARIDRSSLRIPPIFPLLSKLGGISEREMFNVYNMGVGMTAIVPVSEADTAVAVLQSTGQDAYVCGQVVESQVRMELC